MIRIMRNETWSRSRGTLHIIPWWELRSWGSQQHWSGRGFSEMDPFNPCCRDTGLVISSGHKMECPDAGCRVCRRCFALPELYHEATDHRHDCQGWPPCGGCQKCIMDQYFYYEGMTG